MGTYKVIQDIESEDKLFGPFSLRQFIYLIIVIISLFLAFKLVTARLWYISIVLIPHTAFFAMLAAPFGHDQSNEIWLLAKIRFMFKPRKRIWDQTGMTELVTITVPKHVERHLTDNLTQTEVRSRLKALANTIDTRGWAVKNIDMGTYNQYALGMNSDRLVDVSSVTQAPPVDDIPSSFDVLDEYSNPAVQNINNLMNTSEQIHHQQLVSMMQQAQQVPQPVTVDANNPAWFTQNSPQPQQVPQPVVPMTPIVPITPPAPEPVQAIPQVQPLAQAPIVIDQQPVQVQAQAPAPEPVQNNPQIAPSSSVTTPSDAAILELANNDDLNIATIARQADKAVEQSGDGEVVVSLR